MLECICAFLVFLFFSSRVEKFVRFCQRETLADAIDDAEHSNRRSGRIRAIYATPPAPEFDSDEDSAAEDEMHDVNLNRLGPGLLAAPVAVEVEVEENDPVDDIPPEAKRPKFEKWTKTSTFLPEFDCKYESLHDKNDNKDTEFESPVDYFNYFLDESTLKFIVVLLERIFIRDFHKHLNIDVTTWVSDYVWL